MDDRAKAEFGIGDAALALARSGMHVFPVRAGAKTPAVRQWPHFSTTDPTRIRGWWTKHPDLNIAIHTGKSGLVVIDLDAGKPWPDSWGDQPDGVTCGADALVHLADQTGNVGDGSWLWRTPTVVTPSGGLHLYFRAPDGVDLGPSAGVIAPWVDVRAGNSYVVGPWSRTPTGHYRPGQGWHTVETGDVDVDWTVTNPRLARLTVTPPVLPDWLTVEISRASSKPSPSPAHLDRWGRLSARLDAPAGTSAYLTAALDRAYDNVARASEGTRNATLTRETYSLAGLIPHIDEGTVRERMTSAARACGLDQVEAASCIAGAIKRGKASPREVRAYA